MIGFNTLLRDEETSPMLHSGHGGNIRMKDLPNRDYQISVLEVASSSAGPEQISAMENRWKETLLTREFGLNKN